MYKKKDVILTGFALFAMLFGAGNLIFPPVVDLPMEIIGCFSYRIYINWSWIPL